MSLQAAGTFPRTSTRSHHRYSRLLPQVPGSKSKSTLLHPRASTIGRLDFLGAHNHQRLNRLPSFGDVPTGDVDQVRIAAKARLPSAFVNFFDCRTDNGNSIVYLSNNR